MRTAWQANISVRALVTPGPDNKKIPTTPFQPATNLRYMAMNKLIGLLIREATHPS